MNNTIEITWEGHISLNEWYSSKHWSYRKKQKDEWFKTFKSLLDVFPKETFEKYSILLEYNSRLDPSNTITMIKLLEDTMKKECWIVDDSPKYCESLTIRFSQELSKKTYRATITNETTPIS